MPEEAVELLPLVLTRPAPPYPRPSLVRQERYRQAMAFAQVLVPWIRWAMAALMFAAAWRWLSGRPLYLTLEGIGAIWLSGYAVDNWYFLRLREVLSGFYANRYRLYGEEACERHEQEIRVLANEMAAYWRTKRFPAY